MTIEAIAAIMPAPVEALGALSPLSLPAPSIPGTSAAGFSVWFASELNSVNTRLVESDHESARLALGDAANLHQVMIHIEEAKLSFQLLAQVRNKMLEAYQEVMRMQV